MTFSPAFCVSNFYCAHHHRCKYGLVAGQECARYLETYKSYESKPPDLIQEHVENNYTSRLSAALTYTRGINKTDAVTLGLTFNKFSNVLAASKEELSACPGIGPTKVSAISYGVEDCLHPETMCNMPSPQIVYMAM